MAVTGSGCSSNSPGMQSVYERYLGAWSAISRADRAMILIATLADDFMYFNLTLDLVGRAALANHIEGFQILWPSARLVVTRIDEQRRMSIMEWTMFDHSGEAVTLGSDVIELAADGRIATVTGFFNARERIDSSKR